MKVILAKEYGFCFGVRRVLKILDEQLAQNKEVFSIGEIIHNHVVIERYREKGVRFVEKPTEVEEGVGVVRAHGLPQSMISEAEHFGREIIDGTCAFVRHISKIIQKEREIHPDFSIYLVGEPEHPEVIAATADLNGMVKVIDYRTFDPVQFRVPPRAVLLSQTTLEEDVFIKIAGYFIREGQEVFVYNTICPSTRKRQRAARELAQQVDAVVVLGGKKSSNTRRLYEICQAIKPSFLVERIFEIPVEELKKYEVVGVTAGASTPDEVIQEALHYLQNL
ncbi:4-hydroxy-3-methylbut-2-enyl diphosphate reductase [Thermospira aquatica]|uniref:4-hydroxy-3-methylbut-2-enyl diphosphate reductase n=1 Tax=Thermospira aquatica TaxID=2828656 RepID=A0AAX3BD82_9SPIR|nr:4-hydroxy-3-methylbut-2-enyl diphosphate reductase [Thermospira aquatica]URA10204.1 4-hydroxy-3-methylbut-2-enyl diphosphate reductase [Thermospira aquatica]